MLHLTVGFSILCTSVNANVAALETYDQALNWLGAESDYPDDAIITLHTAKVRTRMISMQGPPLIRHRWPTTQKTETWRIELSS